MGANPRSGTQLKDMLERSFKWAQIQRKEADAMTLAWYEFVSGWREMWDAFKRDPSNPNPFEEPDPGRSACLRVRSQSKYAHQMTRWKS